MIRNYDNIGVRAKVTRTHHKDGQDFYAVTLLQRPNHRGLGEDCDTLNELMEEDEYFWAGTTHENLTGLELSKILDALCILNKTKEERK